MHIAEFHNQFPSPTVSIRYTVHAVCTVEMKMHTKFKLGNLNRRDNLKDLHVHGKTILRMIIRNVMGSDEMEWNGIVWTGFIWIISRLLQLWQ